MKFRPSNFIQLTLATIVSILSFSCNKDSDLLAEYVVEQPQAFLVNDVVVTLANNPIVIEPLSNDTFKEPEKVTITEVTPPKMGTAEVQEDNTVVYTPNTDETGTDEFDYTTTVTNSDNIITTETGSISVTVTPTDKTPTDPNAVNFSKYGAVGDGKTDDTKALQAALDAEDSLIANEGAIYKITTQLDIDKSGNQTIDWKGATILIGVELTKCIDINKSSGILTMHNLNIDGDLKGEWIMQINSSFDFDNIHIKDVYSDDQAAIGMYIRITKTGNWSTLKLKNCSINNVTADGNGVIGDNQGAARAILYDYITTPSNLHGLIENCDFRNVFGEDADVLQYRSNDQNWNTGSTVTFNNTKFEVATRRIGKIFAGDITFNNCTFTNIQKSHENIKYAKETGGFLSLSNTAGTEPARRIVFDNCIFNGSDFDNRIIQNKATDIRISNSTWNNVDYRMWIYGGGVCISNNTMTPSSKIYTVTFLSWYGPMIIEGNKNTSSNFKEFLTSNPPARGEYQCAQ